MRVLYLNTADIAGGAAIAAMRLAESLEKYFELETLFLVSEKYSQKKNVIQTRGKILWFIEKSFNKLASFLGYQYFWIPFSSAKILKEAKKFQPDIIHFHNIHGGYVDYRTLIKLREIAPIVWTLHDAWIGTAHCALTLDCKNWINTCENCENALWYPFLFKRFVENFNIKKNTVKQLNPFLISPSKWLSDFILTNPITLNIRKSIISNPINLNDFFPIFKDNINKNKSLLISAAKLNDILKGGDLILPLLEKLDNKINQKIEVVFLGSCKQKIENKFENIEIKYVGSIPSKDVVKYYQNADIYIMLSKSDNQPLTVMEAMACGVPVVAFNVGGIPEMVVSGKTGEIVEPFDVDAFALAVKELLENNEKREFYSKNCIEFIVKNCSDKIVSDRYYKIYNTLIPADRSVK